MLCKSDKPSIIIYYYGEVQGWNTELCSHRIETWLSKGETWLSKGETKQSNALTCPSCTLEWVS